MMPDDATSPEVTGAPGRDLSRRFTIEEVAELVRQAGLPVIGDDMAWLAKHGVVLDFPARKPLREDR